MSWEGYEQCLCTNGHYFISGPHNPHNCPDCECFAVFINTVDDTNCDSFGEIPLEALQQVAAAVTETCSHCGHVKLIASPRYRVPTADEQKHLRHWRPGYGDTPLVKLE